MTRSGIASVCMAIGFMLVAGSARAQFDECVLPAGQPDAVFTTILDQASFGFGEVSEKTCKSIVKIGVSACKAQVNAAAKCWYKVYDTNYAISLKQCNELEDPSERADCKAGIKTLRDEGKSDIDSSKATGLDVCDEQFAGALRVECLDLDAL